MRAAQWVPGLPAARRCVRHRHLRWLLHPHSSTAVPAVSATAAALASTALVTSTLAAASCAATGFLRQHLSNVLPYLC